MDLQHKNIHEPRVLATPLHHQGTVEAISMQFEFNKYEFEDYEDYDESFDEELCLPHPFNVLLDSNLVQQDLPQKLKSFELLLTRDQMGGFKRFMDLCSFVHKLLCYSTIEVHTHSYLYLQLFACPNLANNLCLS